MTRIALAVALLFACAVLVLSPPAGRAGEEASDAPADLSAKAIAAWGKTCQKCHAVPDTRFETDRAFLGQIMETT
jgi:cytochrome c553